MNNHLHNHLLRSVIPLLLAILGAIAWCAVMLLIGHPSALGGSGWLAFAYVLFSIAMATICFSVHRIPKNDSALIGIPFYYSVSYVGIAALLNGAFILAEMKSLEMFVIAADVVLLAVYWGIMIFAYLHQDRIPQKAREVERQTAFSTSVSSALGALLANTDDADIHQALLKLKEKVDYSTNTTQKSTFHAEINSKIAEIRTSLDRGADREEIMKHIEEMAALWNQKNALQ